MQGCEDSYMYIYCIFPPPVIGMLATYLWKNWLVSFWGSVGGRLVSSPDWEALPFSWRWLLASMRRTHCGGPYRQFNGTYALRGRTRYELQHRADIDFYRYRTVVDLQHWLIDETYPPVFSHPQHHSLTWPFYWAMTKRWANAFRLVLYQSR